MRIRKYPASLRLYALIATLLAFVGNAAIAQENMRIERPGCAQKTNSLTTPTSLSADQSMPAGQTKNSCCSPEISTNSVVSSSLPEEGLYAHWLSEFVNPTMCPVMMCHGSCRKSSMSCRNIKPWLDSLLDAFVPEEAPPVSAPSFRCCAGFKED